MLSQEGIPSRQPKVLPFLRWCPLLYKAPPRQFQPPKCNGHPPKGKLAPSKKRLATSDLQLCIDLDKISPPSFTSWRVSICIWGHNSLGCNVCSSEEKLKVENRESPEFRATWPWCRREMSRHFVLTFQCLRPSRARPKKQHQTLECAQPW